MLIIVTIKHKILKFELKRAVINNIRKKTKIGEWVVSLNLNTNLYNAYGIDSANISKVSSQILGGSSNETQPTVQNIDYSKFNRATLGVDLYSSRTGTDLQRQISMTQAGLYAQSVNVAKLNSQAAMNLYSAVNVQKNVSQMQSFNQSNESEVTGKTEANNNTIRLFNIQDKNANSSNGFNPFTSNESETTEEKSETENTSIFA